MNIVKEQNHNGEEESTEKIKPAPPSTGDLDLLCQDIRERLSKLCMREK